MVNRNRIWLTIIGMVLFVVYVTSFNYGGCGSGGGGNPTGSSAYNISGTVTLSGGALPSVTISLSGAVSNTTVTDAGGYYAFTALSNGNYILTPSKAGYTFSPSSISVALSGAHITNRNFIGTLVDITAPSVPANLSATAVSSAQINLSWSASTDNVSVTGYNVFRGTTTIFTTTATTYIDTGLITGTTYSYTVKAFDSAGNISGASSLVSATTLVPGSSLPSLLVGTWGVASLHRTNAGAWQTESSKLTVNNDGTGTGTGNWNNNGSLSNSSYTFTYTATANVDGTVTLAVYFVSGASGTWSARLILSDDGKIMLTDGTRDTTKVFMQVWVRLDASKTYANADLNGAYYARGYQHNLPAESPIPYESFSSTFTYDGAGGFSAQETVNESGAIITSSYSGTYVVNSAGSFVNSDITGTGYLTGDGLVYIDPNNDATDCWGLYAAVKKADKTYSVSDFAGKWAFVTFGEFDQTNFRSEIGTFTMDAAGNVIDSSMRDLRSSGLIEYYPPSTGTITVAADGGFTETAFFSGSPITATGYIGNNGNTLVMSSFDEGDLRERSMVIGIKCAGIGDIAAGTVTGTVTYTGSLGPVSASKPIIVMMNPFPDVFDGFVPNGATYQTVTLTASSSVFTFTNVPPGQYHLVVILDVNNDGVTTGDPGEIYTPASDAGSNYNADPATSFTITAGQIYSTLPNITFNDTMRVGQ